MARTYPILRMILNETNFEFRDSDILECTVTQETHPISLELPAGQASVLIYTTDPRFNMFEDAEFYSSLAQNIPADLYEYIDGTEHFIGRYYLENWKVPKEKQINFEFVDAIGVLDDVPYNGSFWEVTTPSTPVTAIIYDILKTTKLTYTIAAGVSDRTLSGWIAPGTCRQALQQVCFAANLMVSTAKSGSIQINDALLPGDAGVVLANAITDADKTNDQKLLHLPLVTDINLVSHNYYHPESGQPIEEIFNEWMEPGTYFIPYSKPYWFVWVTGVGGVPIVVTTEDERIIVTEGSTDVYATATMASESEDWNYSSNYVTVQVTTAGQLLIQGYPWIDNMREHKYLHVPPAGSNPPAPYGKKIDSSTLVSATNAATVLEKVVDYYGLRYQQNIRLLPNTTATLGDIQIVDSLYGKDIIGITEKLVSDLTGGFLIEAEIVGLERTDN